MAEKERTSATVPGKTIMNQQYKCRNKKTTLAGYNKEEIPTYTVLKKKH